MPFINSHHSIFTNVCFSFLQSLTLKEKVNPLKNFKEKASEEGHSYKNLLLSMVRLIHANPLLMLNVICLI
jgi:neurofibromin 1